MMERNASTRAVPPEWADGLIMSLRCCGLIALLYTIVSLHFQSELEI